MFWEREFHFGNGNSQNSKIILGMEISITKMIFEFCEFPFPLFPILFQEFLFPEHLCFSGVSRNFLWGGATQKYSKICLVLPYIFSENSKLLGKT